LTLDFLWQVLQKRKWLVLGVATLVFAIAGLINFSITPTYRSSAKIRIQPEAARIFPHKDIYESSASFLETEAYLETQCEVLRSEALAQRVINELNLHQDPRWIQPDQGILRWLQRVTASSGDRGEDFEQTEKLIENLEIQPIGRSRIVEVSYCSPYPNLATSIVNTLAEDFIQYNMESRYSTTSKAASFITGHLGKLKKRIEESERELVDYVRKHEIVNFTETDNIITQRLADLNRRRTQVETDLIVKQAEYSEIQHTTAEKLPQTVKNEGISKLESRLHELEQSLANLTSVHGAKWPEVIRVRHEISEVGEQLQEERELALREAVEQARIDYEVAQNSYNGLMRALQQQRQLATNASEASIQYSLLRRDVEANKEVYEGLLQRVKEASVAAGLGSVDIQVIDFGKLPSAPHRPLTFLNLLLGLVVGLMSGFGLALAVEYTDKTLRTPGDLERQLALPCLGIIPRVLSQAEHPSLSEQSRLEAQLMAERVLEAYRSLRTAILVSRGQTSPQTILLTSALPGEGKTTTAAQLGIVLAQTNRPTLILDLDLRKPEIYEHFKVTQNLGLSYLLEYGSSLSREICETNYHNLYLLPGGTAVPNPSELIGSRWMLEALAFLRQHFRYIVIDSAPVLSFTDTTIISPHIDATIFVVRSGHSSFEAPKKAKETIENAGGRIRGAVINDVDLKTVFDPSHLLGYYPVERVQSSSGSERAQQV
jgi:capsular exopolysaccharide synthesis family protein